MVEEKEEDKREEKPETKEKEETEEGEAKKGEEEMAEKKEEVPGEEELEGDKGTPPSEEDGKTVEGELEEEEEISEEEEKSFPEADELSTSRLLTTGLRMVIIALVLASVLYPLVTTGVGNLVWTDAARGDLVRLDGQVVGSRLIGQSFESEKFFHPRPSSKDYDGMDSGSANLSPENEKLTRRAEKILADLKEEGVDPEDVPVSFITESGSALDPHIAPESARLQIPRVSEATGIAKEKLKKIIKDHEKGKFLGLYGLERVNVLSLNIEIEKILESG